MNAFLHGRLPDDLFLHGGRAAESSSSGGETRRRDSAHHDAHGRLHKGARKGALAYSLRDVVQRKSSPGTSLKWASEAAPKPSLTASASTFGRTAGTRPRCRSCSTPSAPSEGCPSRTPRRRSCPISPAHSPRHTTALQSPPRPTAGSSAHCGFKVLFLCCAQWELHHAHDCNVHREKKNFPYSFFSEVCREIHGPSLRRLWAASWTGGPPPPM